MKGKNNIIIYTIIWMFAVLILMFSLFQNLGYAKVINYSGIVRGATQKLVKEELYLKENDQGIAYLDEIISGLQQGGGTYHLALVDDKSYQDQLMEMSHIWEKMKEEIVKVRNGEDKDTLYYMSEDYFDKANTMVATVENLSNHKFNVSIWIFLIYLVITGGFFFLWYFYQQKRLNKIKYFDPLTGLPNVAAFELSLRYFMQQDTETKLAIVYFDIDDFKYLNLTYGYPIGDQILKAVAMTLKTQAVKESLCARISSDNFYICIAYQEGCVEHLITILNETLKKEVALDVIDELTLTIGASLIDQEEDIQTLLDNALLAHKSAKKSGKGCIEWYGSELLDHLNKENMMVKRMHRGLAENEFQLYLQPKFAIPSMHMFGAEALVRWQMQDGMFLYPDEFIPLFETNGFIYEMDFYMLEHVCQFIRDYAFDDDFVISVNFSRFTIHHREFYTKFYEIIQAYEIPHHKIEIEITESAFNDLSASIITMIRKLQEDGFVISMDDFGSGYSSLNLLNSLPLDTLKVDRGFLNEKNANREQIIQLILDIAKTLHINVICEGVETEKDVKMLERVQCVMGQGYYFSKPIAESSFLEIYFSKEHNA